MSEVKKKKKKKKKFKDDFVKSLILKSIQQLNGFCNSALAGSKIIYYEGNFSEDVLNNFSQSQSNNIFEDMKRIHADKSLCFTQKKIKDFKNMDIEEKKEPKFFYEYMVEKIA